MTLLTVLSWLLFYYHFLFSFLLNTAFCVVLRFTLAQAAKVCIVFFICNVCVLLWAKLTEGKFINGLTD